MSIAAESGTAVDPTRRSRRRKTEGREEIRTAPSNSSSPSAPTEMTPQRTYLARKKFKVNGRVVSPGDEVPEAHEWLRVEGWVRAGYLDEVWR